MEKIKAFKNIISKEIAAIIGGALFIAIMSKIAMYLPLSPIPVTMQTLATLLVAAVLGKRGVLSVVTYIILGVAGLPVITSGVFATGYFIGFVAAAYAVGWLFEIKAVNNIWTAFLAFCLGEVIILTCGTLWAARFTEHYFAIAFAPFILGGLFKACLGVYITKIIKKW
jgi:biotin transport system substrate-specific component